MKKQKPPRHAKKMQPAQPQAGAAQRMSGSTASPRRAAKRMQPAQPQVDTAAELRRLRQNYRSISMSIAVLLASVAAYIAMAKVALLFYHPNIEQTIELAQKTLVWGGKPEPVEAFLFRLGVLTIPLFMVGAFMLLTKTRLSSIEWERYFKPLSIGFVLLAVGTLYFGLQALNPNYVEQAEDNNFANSRDTTSRTNFAFYFAESVLSRHPIAYFGVVVPLILLFLLIFKRFHKQLVTPKFMQNVGLLLVLGYAGYYMINVYRIFSFDFPYTWENKYDFNPIYYTIGQVYAGSPMLVDGFTSIYGLYAHFLAPIFRIIGLDISNFTAVMSLLIVLTFALTLVAMLRMVKSKLFVMLGFSSVLFICLLIGRVAAPFDAYFALYPVRHLLPAITICLASFYIKNRNKTLYFTTFALLGFSILWNPEFGLVCLFAWTAMLCYTEFAASNWKSIVLACLRHVGLAVASAVLCVAVFFLLIYLQYGSLPQLMGLFASMAHFGSENLGLMLIPMTLLHPWNFIVLIYLIGLIYAVQALFNKSHLNAKSAFIFLLSVMGIGLFAYFQGRSHNWNLATVSGNAIILLVMFADSLIQKVSIKNSPLSFRLAVIAIITVLGFSCVDLFFHQDKWEALHEQREEKKANINEQKQVEANIAFIQGVLPKTTERIYIHTSNKYQALYFTPTQKRAASQPSIIGIFTYEGFTRLKDKILTDSSDVFLEPAKFYYSYVQGVNAATCATYSVDTTNGQMFYMKKRRYRTPEQPVLEESHNPQVLVYEKFGDDTASLNRRIRCAVEGKEPLMWGDQLSMEVIFFAGQQAYPAGTLFSNYDDSVGVWLLSNGNPEKYLFQWGKEWGIVLDVAPNKWCYLAVQLDKTLMSIFVNGSLRYRYIIPAPVTSTYRRFHIASDGQKNQHFTGAISEVLVKKNLSSLQEIQARQRKIQELLAD